MNDDDYEAIEAAVMETARGRWFLSEFARRSHIDEMRQMLDAVARLEQVVTTNQAVPADPSIRLLVGRLKEVVEQLGCMAQDMRADGLDEKYYANVETQARTLGSLLRLNGAPLRTPERLQAPEAPADPRLARAGTAAVQTTVPAAPVPPLPMQDFDRRYEALATIDRLSSLEKLHLFA